MVYIHSINPIYLYLFYLRCSNRGRSTIRGATGVKRCVTDRSQHNVKKHYKGGGRVQNLSKKRYVIVEQPYTDIKKLRWGGRGVKGGLR